MAPIFLAPLQYASRDLVLLAVSNNPDVQAAGGGSHWSLLAHWRPADAFFHFDSMAGCNATAVRRLYDILRTPSSQLEEVETPQQRNDYECGLVSLAIAQLLARRYVERGQCMQFSLQRSDYNPDALQQLMCNVIDSYAAAEAAEQQMIGVAAGSKPA